MTTYEDGNTLKKESQVTIQFGEMNKALDKLSSVIEELGEQISPIMMPDTPEVKGIDTEKTPDLLVPIASELRALTSTVKNQTYRIQDYLNRIEL